MPFGEMAGSMAFVESLIKGVEEEEQSDAGLLLCPAQRDTTTCTQASLSNDSTTTKGGCKP